MWGQIGEAQRKLFRKTLGELLLRLCLLVPVGFVFGSASGAQTQGASSAKLAEPKFSIRGGLYTNEVSVVLSADSSAKVIRYTLDGSEPTSASTEYSSPIHISESTLLKAKAFGSDSSSATAIEAYSFIDPNLAAFSSNLPLIVLDTFGERVPFGQKIPVAARFVDVKTGRSHLLGQPDFEGLGELNVRGHTSLRYPKHSYHFQTKQEGLGSHKVALLGLPKESDWVLYAPYSDKALMRDVLGYELSNQMGRYAARTRFVEVFLNNSRGKMTQRNYLGVYVFEEKIKRGKNRVDIAKLTPEDLTEPNITGGYIIKKDHSDQVDNPDDSIPMLGGSGHRKDSSFRSSHGNHFYYVEPKGDEITVEQKGWLRQYVNKFEQVLYSDGFTDPKTGYAAYIDPDSFIDHHLLVELCKNIDGYRFSTFYYKDRGGRLNMGPIWDWNLSFGNASARDGVNPEGWYWSQLDDRQYSWFRRLFEDPDFAQRYVDRWGELRTNQFSVGKILARVNEMAALLNEAQERNFRRWRVLGRNVWPNGFVGQNFNDEVDFLRQWIRQRIAWMDEEFMYPPSFSIRGGTVNRGTKLELRARTGKVYYTLDGSDPRAPGGSVSKTAKPYKSNLLLNDSATVFCRATDGTRWSYPAVAKFAVGRAATQ